MKTLQEFYEEVKASDNLKKEFANALRADKITEFLHSHDCDVTNDDLKEFIMERLAQNKKLRLDDDELDLAAGGYHSTACGSDGWICQW